MPNHFFVNHITSSGIWSVLIRESPGYQHLSKSRKDFVPPGWVANILENPIWLQTIAHFGLFCCSDVQVIWYESSGQGMVTPDEVVPGKADGQLVDFVHANSLPHTITHLKDPKIISNHMWFTTHSLKTNVSAKPSNTLSLSHGVLVSTPPHRKTGGIQTPWGS